ncbi:hypothetical protein [Mucilaginibacter ginsenosidivorans]|uniref:Uncharacterized protein n=1 Tax=Mucilaginibacter ginsenosidivorans TaxID=398053 RepID=A0A5B8USG9_9SPHI|nr:hypothetical protein [Mucilaginibacter ginsenosidivorans]QEC61919.1 hypothetical protein FRZ54_04740 [Mucilaginibacter ginsenosidivorans]
MIPNILIGNTPFVLDSDARTLRKYGSGEVVISFNDLKIENGFYSCPFHETQNANGITPLTDNQGKHETFQLTIPQAILEYKEISPQELLNYNTASLEHNWGYYLADECLGRRLVGELPHINIEGSDFTIDWRLKELRETEAPFNCLRFNSMELSENGERYLFFYHRQAHCLFRPGTDSDRLPDHVILIAIPNELKLDPVGVARQYGMKDFELLREFPIQKELRSESIPLAGPGKLKKQLSEKNEDRKQQKKKRNGRHL